MTGKEEIDLLEALTSTPGVPGREERIRAVIHGFLNGHRILDDLRVDALGSLIGIRRPRPRAGVRCAPKRVLVAAHMDQIGFLVSHVSDKGFLRLHPVGAFDIRTLVSQRVRVCTEEGEDLPGIVMPEGHPIHTSSEEELSKTPKMSQLFVELGLPADVVLAKVRLGDMVVLDAPFRDLGDTVTGSAMDNRVGCWALLRALARLESHNCEIHAVWTAQEELGSRGAEPVSFGIDADFGISCDTTVSCELPGVPEEEHITRMGKGVSLQIADSSTLADMELVRQVEAIALDLSIPCQRSLMLGGGQDGAMIQRSGEGVRTIVLSCPVRYLHTSSELVHKGDLESYERLLTELLGSL